MTTPIRWEPFDDSVEKCQSWMTDIPGRLYHNLLLPKRRNIEDDLYPGQYLLLISVWSWIALRPWKQDQNTTQLVRDMNIHLPSAPWYSASLAYEFLTPKPLNTWEWQPKRRKIRLTWPRYELIGCFSMMLAPGRAERFPYTHVRNIRSLGTHVLWLQMQVASPPHPRRYPLPQYEQEAGCTEWYHISQKLQYHIHTSGRPVETLAPRKINTLMCIIYLRCSRRIDVQLNGFRTVLILQIK